MKKKKSEKLEKSLLSYYLRKAEQYETIGKVGEGGFGSIELVEDKNTGKKYAKKVIPFPQEDELAPLYFFREFLSLRCFQFDGLPFLKLEGFNFPEKDEMAFIVTEYVEGGSLKKLIDTKFKKIDDIPTTKMIIIYGISLAIRILHTRNIVHRDVKPENILLDAKVEPILADFGFARLISERCITLTGKLGTLAYMSPELIENFEIKPDLSIDIYSFAVLLFQILYGPLTFKGKNPFSKKNERLFKKHITKGGRFDMPEPGILPESFKKMITECWSQKPTERWTMERIVQALKTEEFILEGCDLEKYNQYINRLDTVYQNSLKETEEEDDDDEVVYTKEFCFLQDE